MKILLGFALSLGFLSAAEVKTAKTPLRASCDPYDSVIATLPEGAAITIRYAVSGESVACYKVSAETGGKTIDGFLPASAINGLEDFDKARQAGAWLDTPQIVAAVKEAMPVRPAAGSVGEQAEQLIDANRPLKALELLEADKMIHHDPNLMALAGLASWKSDDPKRALEYWRTSLDLLPNPGLQALYNRVEREAKGDQSNERVYGMRVLLRYESPTVSSDTARQMVAVLDEELTRISNELGCSADERIIAIAQSNEAYRKTTGAAEWSGGQFDGRIRVPIFDGKNLDSGMRKVLAHETAHACLTMLGQWPPWLHEGIAQMISGDSLAPGASEKIAQMLRAKQLPTLDQLGKNWSGLTTQQAGYAYAMALDAMEIFRRDYAAFGLRNLLRSPERLADITADLNRKLAQ